LDSIRKTKQRIKALFLFHGMKEPDEVVHWSSKSIQALLATPFLVDDKNVLKSHIRELSFFLREKKLVETQIHEICSRADHCDVYDALRTVPGVGFVTASTFCLELFDPERFDRAEPHKKAAGRTKAADWNSSIGTESWSATVMVRTRSWYKLPPHWWTMAGRGLSTAWKRASSLPGMPATLGSGWPTVTALRLKRNQ
jgi:hypothetical protein